MRLSISTAHPEQPSKVVVVVMCRSSIVDFENGINISRISNAGVFCTLYVDLVLWKNYRYHTLHNTKTYEHARANGRISQNSCKVTGSVFFLKPLLQYLPGPS